MSASDDYKTFVEHPRFGREPKITGVTLPGGVKNFLWSVAYATFGKGVSPHWRLIFSPRTAIQGTGVLADRSLHGNTNSLVSHYFDEVRTCEMCSRKFIFFAEKQKHWYEELGFNLNANAVECVECRKANQGHRKLQRRYEELFGVEDKTDEENLEMAEVALELIEAKVFGSRVAERVRTALNRCSLECKSTERYLGLRKRLK